MPPFIGSFGDASSCHVLSASRIALTTWPIGLGAPETIATRTIAKVAGETFRRPNRVVAGTMSTERTPRTPGPDHPITLDPTTTRVVVRLGGRTIADTRRAIELQESDYPPVHYIPRSDVDMSLLQRTSHATYCPYKGEASYYGILVDGRVVENAVWTYESPYPAVAAIKEYLAFYPERVDAIEVVT